MVTVVGIDRDIQKEITCKHCGSILQYLPHEVFKYCGTDYGGGPDGKEYIICPACSEQVIIRSW